MNTSYPCFVMTDLIKKSFATYEEAKEFAKSYSKQTPGRFIQLHDLHREFSPSANCIVSCCNINELYINGHLHT